MRYQEWRVAAPSRAAREELEQAGVPPLLAAVLSARGIRTREEAQALLLPKVEELKARFGALVYGVDVPSLEYVVLEGLKARGLTLGTAESCTGGLIAKRLTDVSGSSQVFRGGVVSYTNEVKHGVLGVPQAVSYTHLTLPTTSRV